MSDELELDGIESAYPLGSVQSGILYHVLSDDSSDLYLAQFVLELKGDLEIGQWKKAWASVVERYEALRSFVAWEGLDGPIQLVQCEVELNWHVKSYADESDSLVSFFAEDRRHSLELSQAPLYRLALLELAPERRLFVWTFHHIMLDGWSVRIVVQRVLEEYGARIRGEKIRVEESLSFGQALERRESYCVEGAKTYWENVFRNISSTNALREAGYLGQGQKVVSRFRVERSLAGDPWQGIRNFVRQNSLTLSSFVHGAWALLLQEYTGGGRWF